MSLTHFLRYMMVVIVCGTVGMGLAVVGHSFGVPLLIMCLINGTIGFFLGPLTWMFFEWLDKVIEDSFKED